jgi:hypothetical protein
MDVTVRMVGSPCFFPHFFTVHSTSMFHQIILQPVELEGLTLLQVLRLQLECDLPDQPLTIQVLTP